MRPAEQPNYIGTVHQTCGLTKRAVSILPAASESGEERTVLDFPLRSEHIAFVGAR